MNKRQKKKFKVYVYRIGFAYLFTSSFILTLTFLAAYFTPTKTAIITINDFGEADIELIMILGVLPFVVLLFWDVMGNLLPKMKQDSSDKSIDHKDMFPSSDISLMRNKGGVL